MTVAQISEEKEMQMVQRVLKEIASNPTIVKLGFASSKTLFERQLLLCALERHNNDPAEAAAELQIHPNLMRYHLRYTLGRTDIHFHGNARRIDKKIAASEKLTAFERQRKLRF